ncbi:MAG: glycosyltransferase family 4 protein [Clostridiales bacterium]|nr:glycosyltransferase family 4 protein [Clostridiales bacterium]
MKQSGLARTVLFVNNFPGPTLGGGEIHLMQLVRALLRDAWHVRVIAAQQSELARTARDAGAHVDEFEFSYTYLPSVPARIRGIAVSSGADIVIGTGFLTNVLVRLAMRAVPGVAVVNIAHTEPDAARYEGAGAIALAARRRVERCALDRVDAFVAISSEVSRALLARGVDGRRVHTICNAVDPAAVRADAQAIALPPVMARQLSARVPLVGYVGRLSLVKGAEYFIQMAARLVQREPDVCFVVVGSGPEEGRLREIAAAYALGERLVFLGHVSPAAPVLAACDVVVLPSLSEGMPTVTLEAMALAKPVVATRVGGLPDVVADGETGLLVPPADPDALAEAVASLLRDPARARAMGEAGRARVEERFTLERMLAEYRTLFDTLAG